MPKQCVPPAVHRTKTSCASGCCIDITCIAHLFTERQARLLACRLSSLTRTQPQPQCARP